jgi:hypothetical protein
MLILKGLEGNIIPAQNWRFAGFLLSTGAETHGKAIWRDFPQNKKSGSRAAALQT